VRLKIFGGQGMNFDRYTIVLLLLAKHSPAFTAEEESRLQDAHMAHLADLHAAGQLLAAGPVLGPADRELRGFSILNVDPDKAVELKVADPAVQAGKYRIQAYPWVLPSGLMRFSPGHLPRSMAETSESA
jgi:uncharacterized protein YciI